MNGGVIARKIHQPRMSHAARRTSLVVRTIALHVGGWQQTVSSEPRLEGQPWDIRTVVHGVHPGLEVVGVVRA